MEYGGRGGVGMMVKTRRSPGLGRGKQSTRVSDTDIDLSNESPCLKPIGRKTAQILFGELPICDVFESAPFEESALGLE